MRKKDLFFKDLFNFCIKHFGQEWFGKDMNSKSEEKLKNKFFEFLNNFSFGNCNYIMIDGFRSKIQKEKIKIKSYEKKIKFEETLPFYIHMWGYGYISFFNNFSFSLRSKKNNRPIYMDFKKINHGFISGLLGACKTFMMPNVAWKTKISSLSKYIMQMVFVGKDEQLLAQEQLFADLFVKYRMSHFYIKIKDFYKDIESRKNLLHLYNIDTNLLEYIKGKNKEFMKNIKKISDLRNKDLTILIDSEEGLNIISNFLNKQGIKYEKGDSKKIFSKEIEEYTKKFIFFQETIHTLIKNRKLGLTDLYKGESFKNDDIPYTKVIDNIMKIDVKGAKEIIKKIYKGFDFPYIENVFNSFLTQTDLSNSLELTQDCFQKHIQTLGIGWDDMYIDKINAEMFRIPKGEKKETILKNVNFFMFKKIFKNGQ